MLLCSCSVECLLELVLVKWLLLLLLVNCMFLLLIVVVDFIVVPNFPFRRLRLMLLLLLVFTSLICFLLFARIPVVVDSRLLSCSLYTREEHRILFNNWCLTSLNDKPNLRRCKVLYRWLYSSTSFGLWLLKLSRLL